MKVKIDTREKLTLFIPEESYLSVNLTAEFIKEINSYLSANKNIVLNLKDVTDADNAALEMIFDIQQKFYEAGISLVICEIKPLIEKKLEEADLLAMMNIIPTEAEAIDIVQMEEIERELNDEEKENDEK